MRHTHVIGFRISCSNCKTNFGCMHLTPLRNCSYLEKVNDQYACKCAKVFDEEKTKGVEDQFFVLRLQFYPLKKLYDNDLHLAWAYPLHILDAARDLEYSQHCQ